MGSYRPVPWLNQQWKSLPFSRHKPLALLEYNKLKCPEIALSLHQALN